jgi:hypothetical protein
MVYDPNANWTAGAGAAHQAPIYFITVEGDATRYSTGPVKNPGATYKRYLRTPRGVTQEIFPLQGKSSIGSLSLDLVDVDGDITELLSPGQIVPTWINRNVTLFGGYADLDEADFAELFLGQVSDWGMKGPVYTIKVRDLKRTTLEKIMVNATEDTPSTIEGNPINVWYALVTGDFANVTFPVTTSGAAATGLDVSTSLIDETHLENERDEWLFGWNMRFEFRRPEKAKKFFEDELFLLKGYPLIRGSGQLSVRLYHPAHPAESPQDLDEDNLLVGVVSVKPLFKDHLNVIEIYGDHDPDFDESEGESEFTLLYSFEDSSDITATKERRELIIESKGLRTELDGVRNARFAGGKIRQRYLEPPIEIVAETLFSKRALELGDVVGVTHPALPDMDTGARGWTKEQCEVVKAVPDFRRGRMRFTLITTNFGRRYRVIAPNSVPDYTSQTQAQKDKYMSIADTGTELLGGADPAHQII